MQIKGEQPFTIEQNWLKQVFVSAVTEDWFVVLMWTPWKVKNQIQTMLLAPFRWLSRNTDQASSHLGVVRNQTVITQSPAQQEPTLVTVTSVITRLKVQIESSVL